MLIFTFYITLTNHSIQHTAQFTKLNLEGAGRDFHYRYDRDLSGEIESPFQDIKQHFTNFVSSGTIGGWSRKRVELNLCHLESSQIIILTYSESESKLV